MTRGAASFDAISPPEDTYEGIFAVSVLGAALVQFATLGVPHSVGVDGRSRYISSRGSGAAICRSSVLLR